MQEGPMSGARSPKRGVERGKSVADSGGFAFRVTDLKQFTYCPRILYYHTVLPRIRPTTDKMAHGIEAHERAAGLEHRRGLRAYGLREGERHFNVPLYDPASALSGEVDMVIEREEEVIPVDYKATNRHGKHFHLQLVAYGHLLEAAWPVGERTIRRGFLYLIPERRAVEVPFTPSLRRAFHEALRTMHAVAREQVLPASTKQRRRCVDCEFRRFCNDIF